ncbi:hypothetical protein LOC71_15405 [Rhodopirellula sp. JC740]|uniref:Uncharacterized protein n=1 Tax=Rhodopirellula halodulae TaxID=2894198 RepID=A0ABS8NJH3_9BACT|nr:MULTISPECIES: hypothetical protein [unclassified Rhodopirellula]MCC9643671.1 hypothetical protein [Rhodopirellula sp. JC740]MCC9656829.1 hypothetical protein [Rhodopirellula sp. JC737]
MNALWGQTFLTNINWLWVAGAAIAAWTVVGAMSRRQAHLTGLLRDHVSRTQDAQKAALEASQKPNEAESE